jgi:hypothetical protein
MPPDSRRKGRDAEREVERIIEGRGIEVDRYQGGRKQERGDLGIPGVRIDSKRQERLQLVKWSREQEAKVPDHLTPAVAYRTNNEPWRISLLLEDFLELYLQATS